jgi:hypothetical protein
MGIFADATTVEVPAVSSGGNVVVAQTETTPTNSGPTKEKEQPAEACVHVCSCDACVCVAECFACVFKCTCMLRDTCVLQSILCVACVCSNV